MDIIEAAADFARERHGDQKRKYTDEPYFNHVRHVAGLVRAAGMDSHVQAAAFMHDLLEDTATTFDEIEALFGPWTAKLVWWVTDQSTYEDGNRKARKAIDRQHLAIAPPAAQSIKLADLIDNTRTIVKYDPGFAKIYLIEKSLLLPLLTGGKPSLQRLAKYTLQEANKTLGVAT